MIRSVRLRNAFDQVVEIMELSQTESGSMSANFVESLLQMQSFLDDGAQNVNRNRNP